MTLRDVVVAPAESDFHEKGVDAVPKHVEIDSVSLVQLQGEVPGQCLEEIEGVDLRRIIRCLVFSQYFFHLQVIPVADVPRVFINGIHFKDDIVVNVTWGTVDIVGSPVNVCMSASLLPDVVLSGNCVHQVHYELF